MKNIVKYDIISLWYSQMKNLILSVERNNGKTLNIGKGFWRNVIIIIAKIKTLYMPGEKSILKRGIMRKRKEYLIIARKEIKYIEIKSTKYLEIYVRNVVFQIQDVFRWIIKTVEEIKIVKNLALIQKLCMKI